jgi:hypothetical protein
MFENIFNRSFIKTEIRPARRYLPTPLLIFPRCMSREPDSFAPFYFGSYLFLSCTAFPSFPDITDLGFRFPALVKVMKSTVVIISFQATGSPLCHVRVNSK